MLKSLVTEDAPAAFGPYSQGIDAGGLVFVSGQLGVDPKTGEMAEGTAEQAKLVMKNIAAVLAQAGCTYDNVVKTTIFLADINDFSAVNEIYGACFTKTKPARSTFQVAALPKNAKVEIEVIAAK